MESSLILSTYHQVLLRTLLHYRKAKLHYPTHGLILNTFRSTSSLKLGISVGSIE